MKHEIKIIDNFLSKDNFLKLQEKVLTRHFPWFYCDHASLDPRDNFIKDELAKETDGYAHVFYDRQHDVKSFTYDYLIDFYKAIENLGFTQEHLIRVRASVKSPKKNYTLDNYNLPHVDYFFPHDVMIYYLNDSDGDTRIFDQKFIYTGNNYGLGFDTFTTSQRITPKANRLVWFDGFVYHTASNPVESTRRVILNINLMPR